jgi:hypothetical protein
MPRDSTQRNARSDTARPMGSVGKKNGAAKALSFLIVAVRSEFRH